MILWCRRSISPKLDARSWTHHSDSSGKPVRDHCVAKTKHIQLVKTVREHVQVGAKHGPNLVCINWSTSNPHQYPQAKYDRRYLIHILGSHPSFTRKLEITFQEKESRNILCCGSSQEIVHPQVTPNISASTNLQRVESTLEKNR